MDDKKQGPLDIDDKYGKEALEGTQSIFEMVQRVIPESDHPLIKNMLCMAYLGGRMRGMTAAAEILLTEANSKNGKNL